MGNVGGLEVLVVLLVALVVLGPEKLPEAVRKVGNVVGELRRVSKSFQDEMRSAAMLDDFGIETKARDKGTAAVAASKAKQASMEPLGRSLTEDTEPFTNTESIDDVSDSPRVDPPGAETVASEVAGDTDDTGNIGNTDSNTSDNTSDNDGDDDQPLIESDA